MTLHKVYRGEETVGRYDEHHFGGPVGQQIFQQECEVLDNFLRHYSGRLLDIPCGTGIYSARFHELGYDVVASDASFEMLQLTVSRGYDFEILQSDIFHLPFGDDSFDVVVTLRLFQHFPLPHVSRAMQELQRVVKPNGLVIFDTFRWTPKQMPLIKRFFKGEMYVYAPAKVKTMIDTSGLKLVRHTSRHLFSPIRQRKLPYGLFRGIHALEKKVPQRWLLRTFWACTKVSS